MGASKNIDKLSNENFDDWLHSLGYLYPLCERHLKRFDTLYQDYDFKLKNQKVNIESIVDGTFCEVSRIVEIKLDSFTSTEISSLKMVARKGNENIPDHIKEKMKKNNKKKKGDSE